MHRIGLRSIAEREANNRSDPDLLPSAVLAVLAVLAVSIITGSNQRARIVSHSS